MKTRHLWQLRKSHEMSKTKSIKMHKPVLLGEVLKVFENAPLKDKVGQKKVIVDATLGFAGHAVEIIKKGWYLLGVDYDSESLEEAKVNLNDACPDSYTKVGVSHFKLIKGNFKDIKTIVQKSGIGKVDGVLFDLGVNTPQLTSQIRGLSFSNPNAPLDMRLDRSSGVTAADLLNGLRKDQLMDMFLVTTDYHTAKRLASEIIRERNDTPFRLVGQFLEVIKYSKTKSRKSLNPATLPFLALRIAVNSELENLKLALEGAFTILRRNGVLVVISFHSKEDEIVKLFIKNKIVTNKARTITKKPIYPTPVEKANNVRARSARMRILIKD